MPFSRRLTVKLCQTRLLLESLNSIKSSYQGHAFRLSRDKSLVDFLRLRQDASKEREAMNVFTEAGNRDSRSRES